MRPAERRHLFDVDRPQLPIVDDGPGVEPQQHAMSRLRVQCPKCALQSAGGVAVEDGVFAVNEWSRMAGQQHFRLIAAEYTLRNQPLCERDRVALLGTFHFAELALQSRHRSWRRHPAGHEQAPEIRNGNRHCGWRRMAGWRQGGSGRACGHDRDELSSVYRREPSGGKGHCKSSIDKLRVNLLVSWHKGKILWA